MTPGDCCPIRTSRANGGLPVLHLDPGWSSTGAIRCSRDAWRPGAKRNAPMRTSAMSALHPKIGIGGSLAAPPLPHHRTYGSVYGGSRSYANALRSNDSNSCWLGVRVHAPPRAIRCLPVPPAGLHPSASMRSPVSTGCSAACRSRDLCPTCLSSRSGLQPSFPVRPIC